MSVPFRPMLAPNNDPMKDPNFFKSLRYPLLCSPKLDGIRCVIRDSTCLSRTLIPLPSIHVQRMFNEVNYCDGELIQGCSTDFDVYNRTQSYVMSEDKYTDDMHYYVFDTAAEHWADFPFEDRLEIARELVAVSGIDNMHFVEHTLCENEDELLAYEELNLELGYEGIMMRDPLGIYKGGHGGANRGTFKEGLIYKLKRFTDAEGIVIGFIEGTRNTNEDIRSNTGTAKRSTSQAGLVLAGTLGKFVVDYNGQTLMVGCGNFNHKERQFVWEHSHQFLGKYLKFRFFGHGQKNMPRMPRAIGFRDEMDM